MAGEDETGHVQVLAGREVPLGGQRALTVRRTLPHRDRSFLGAWCFVDHYGPVPVGPGERVMDVPPHPHTGLQTVSWLFEGVVQHDDSAGVSARVLPGEVNLMTAGSGIAHSEVSTDESERLHGVQLWVALPDADRHGGRGFAHHAPEAVPLPGGAGTALAFLGTLPGVDVSPLRTSTPLLGAPLDLAPGAALDLAVDPAFEHGVLLDEGEVGVDGVALSPADLACLDPGPRSVRLVAGDSGARLVLIGGTPFEEEVVMWWNFVGRTHDEVVAYREAYEAGSEQFGTVPGYDGERTRIPAPPLPPVRLRARNRRGRLPA
ncbi:pirin family protein [Janibacter melonis]|uniref:pirin family protein n=1 Tax=Janibacter melonis TaxID=262209 RepID=UPI0020962843|nr:pirin family protein [Janibacter melonis]